ncbi:ATP-binding cassette domain-containing protein [Hymenobacter sp. HMF4947]|uniref:ATP-binding cassette domain-containing protein n=1 Tax=Hymenobacter ginkgonis TaxID=2682976 RepID=A0A7K1TIY3_9BACT|nr:ABC transporter ATP-binding protein [Hymenobacter ginkgonis]MVN78141.1 ATP-binding cassette domain-containing protein [Hymenobacter ginkgonis]
MELRIQNLSKTYANGVRALHNVSLTIPNGMFGLLGPNGAGKSSLMRTIATLQEPDAGTITLGTLDVLTEKDAVRRVLGYLPQEFGLYPSISAEVLLDHFASLKGIRDARERKLAVEALLQQTNLWAARKKNLGGYSGGMRQRFGIAVALLGAPQLIIVDEPTAGLDPTERNRFLDLLSEIGENVVVILSTHIVEDVTELCSNMAIIAGGEVVATGQPSEVIGELRGKVYRTKTEKAALAQLKSEYEVISSKLVAGQPVVRVFSDQPINGQFQPAEATLEDVYFHRLARRDKSVIA